MSNYLVTGAAGFIGGAIAKRLIAEGHEVVTIDNLSTGFRECVPEGVEFIKGDCSDESVIGQLKGRRFDAVFHLAGQSGGVTCWDKPIVDLNSNVASTLLLLDYTRKYDCGAFVYASSMATYGDVEKCPVDEEERLKPKTFYSTGKIASEHYMNIFSDQYGIKTTALRLNNIYGPGQNMENLLQGMASIYLAYAVKDHHIPVLGSKDRFRDFVFIDDTVNAFILAAKGKESALFNYYNVATEKRTTVEELIAIIKENMPFEVSVEYKEEGTQGDQFGIYCTYDKIKSALGWEPTMELKHGMDIMCKWALGEEVLHG